MLLTVPDTPATFLAAAPAPTGPALGVALAVSGLEIVAVAVLVLALAALAAALRGLSRQPGGIRSLFLARPSETDDPTRRTADELRLLIEEAGRLSDQLAERFDGRAEEMDGLLREADDRIARLEGALSAAAHAPRTPAPGPPPDPDPPGSGRSSRAAVAVEHSAGAQTGDPMAGEIYRLSDEGLPPVEIATRLGQHTGKVELILALRRG